MQFLPGLRLVRRHVHRELDELPVRAIGMALPGNGTTPAVSAARIHLAKHAGMKIMELIEKDIKPQRHPHAGSIPQRADLRDGDRLLDQLGSAPAGNRKRSRRTARA